MSDLNIFYDDSRLMKLFESLDFQEQKKVLQKGLKSAAGMLRKKTVQSLRSSGLKTNRHVERGIRSQVWKKHLGFSVTIRPKRNNLKNNTVDERHKAKLAVIPFWADSGTDERYRTRIRLGIKSKSKNASTGRLKPYKFLEKVEPDAKQLRESLYESIVKNIKKAAEKSSAKLT